MKIKEPFISLPVPTASHDHHAGPARRNHRSPLSTVSEKEKLLAMPPKDVTKELAESSAKSAFESLATSRSAGGDERAQAVGATVGALVLTALRERDGAARREKGGRTCGEEREGESQHAQQTGAHGRTNEREERTADGNDGEQRKGGKVNDDGGGGEG